MDTNQKKEPSLENLNLLEDTLDANIECWKHGSQQEETLHMVVFQNHHRNPRHSNPFSEEDKVGAIQLQQRIETKMRKIDYERSNMQSGNMTKARIMLYDMKQLFMGCVEVYVYETRQATRVDFEQAGSYTLLS